MEGRKQSHLDRHKQVTNGWYHDTTCTLISLPVWNWFLVYRVYRFADCTECCNSGQRHNSVTCHVTL